MTQYTITVVLTGKEYVYPYVKEMIISAVCNGMLLQLKIRFVDGKEDILYFTPARLLRMEVREFKP